MPAQRRPVVFSFSGHDPSGGAGIQADIETITSHHCHSVGVITALTEQNSVNVKNLIPQQPQHIINQARTVLEDIAVDVFKIGLVGHVETAEAIHTIIKDNPNIPVVFDPVLAAGGAANFSNQELLDAMAALLLPLTTVLTPNSQEARQLTRVGELDDCGKALLQVGCNYVLITGTHEETPAITNVLYHDGDRYDTYYWERLPENYHGSGCTLASSIAALIAQGLSPLQAISEAQDYTWNALSNGFQPGLGQYVPNRFFWMEEP